MEVTAENIRPFRIEVPDEQLDDLGRRITATKWQDREIVTAGAAAAAPPPA